jgi:predicted RNA-binding protein with RPS1 domain
VLTPGFVHVGVIMSYFVSEKTEVLKIKEVISSPIVSVMHTEALKCAF